MIESRLSNLSFSKKEFEIAKSDYERALVNSGFKENLKYQPPRPKRRTRSRKVTWFNPPFNASVTTNIGKQFLKLIDKHFPAHHRLHKIFNRNTIKISYSCTPSMKTIVSSHNKQLCESPSNPTKPCNCRQKSSCPLNGECRSCAIIYRATVTADDGSEPRSYIGSTESEFKLRHSNHKSSFNNHHLRTATKLSQHIWQLKTDDKPVDIKWSIQHKSRVYKCGSRKCDLCISEKFEILRSDPKLTLNRRSEIANKCRHRSKFKLANLK